MKIAISISQESISEFDFYKSGMLQNIKFLYELLEQIGAAPFFMNFAESDQTFIAMQGKEYRCETYLNLIKNASRIDLVLDVGVTLLYQQKIKLKETNQAKVVTIRYGNAMIMDIESIVFGAYKLGKVHDKGSDWLWYSPHFERSRYYFQEIYQCEAEPCPYLWEPDFLSDHEECAAEGDPNIYVMEPNINVVKSSLIPICILNHVYRKAPNSFDKGFIVNGVKLQKNSDFLENIAANLPVTHAEANKLYFTPRATFDQAFSNKAILLGHHWENGLNYLYCEALYRGIPLVHNSEEFSEVGYYYEDCNIEEGAAALKNAISEFRDAQDVSANREFLSRFSIHNPDNQKKYAQLIERVLAS